MTRRLPIYPVEPGQVRRDPDPRRKGARTVTVQVVGGRFTYIKSSAGANTRILTDALAKWPLVDPTPETTP
jgi:hypothetical protein